MSGIKPGACCWKAYVPSQSHDLAHRLSHVTFDWLISETKHYNPKAELWKAEVKELISPGSCLSMGAGNLPFSSMKVSPLWV